MEDQAGTSRRLTVGELAARTGVAASALRFYEENGLLHPERNEAGHRRYPRPLVRRVAFIVFAQRVGFTLREVREELEKLPEDRVPRSGDWDRLTGTWTARIDERIEELERLKLGLTGCIGCGCLSLESCVVLNPGDRAADRGPGPRYWLAEERPYGRKEKPRPEG
ncbi:redox-sensitive transcriptional activator SoxR [Rubrobacter indicoceani]|uniref:redox-sensitive transcriptional activator SoxR n=1 Tax=Rubrobacter indicoceani TaxID=2051957 RepID=UPI000E5BBDF3|nr:redox-sensitive transcriptional activator SoxR [Rubrobacter indicoceani]